MNLHLGRGSTLLLSVLFLSSCASVPRGHVEYPVPAVPDYSDHLNWAALPTEKDSADAVPVSFWKDEQSTSAVDVFFIHPTTYTGRAGKKGWNARLEDEKLNERTDQSSIRYQASLFNGTGRVYAPRYRQAHLECFYTKNCKKEATDALDLAYEDVKSAFDYYLEHFNQGRPFIIAGHSQGTLHAARLIQETIENRPVKKQLIVAYLPGMPVRADYFTSIHPCQTEDETGCFCSWRTFREGYLPKKYHLEGQDIVVTNPVTWNADDPESARAEQVGAVLRDFNQVRSSLVETCVHKDLLWVNRPKFPWSFLFITKNYHIADYNFFYGDVRQNAQIRARAFLSK